MIKYGWLLSILQKGLNSLTFTDTLLKSKDLGRLLQGIWRKKTRSPLICHKKTKACPQTPQARQRGQKGCVSGGTHGRGGMIGGGCVKVAACGLGPEARCWRELSEHRQGSKESQGQRCRQQGQPTASWMSPPHRCLAGEEARDLNVRAWSDPRVGPGATTWVCVLDLLLVDHVPQAQSLHFPLLWRMVKRSLSVSQGCCGRSCAIYTGKHCIHREVMGAAGFVSWWVAPGEKGKRVETRPPQEYRCGGARPQPQGCRGSTKKEAAEQRSLRDWLRRGHKAREEQDGTWF